MAMVQPRRVVGKARQGWPKPNSVAGSRNKLDLHISPEPPPHVPTPARYTWVDECGAVRHGYGFTSVAQCGERDGTIVV
jgi:hypothetical protein